MNKKEEAKLFKIRIDETIKNAEDLIIKSKQEWLEYKNTIINSCTAEINKKYQNAGILKRWLKFLEENDDDTISEFLFENIKSEQNYNRIWRWFELEGKSFFAQFHDYSFDWELPDDWYDTAHITNIKRIKYKIIGLVEDINYMKSTIKELKSL
jgi:hypothetical protein